MSSRDFSVFRPAGVVKKSGFVTGGNVTFDDTGCFSLCFDSRGGVVDGVGVGEADRGKYDKESVEFVLEYIISGDCVKPRSSKEDIDENAVLFIFTHMFFRLALFLPLFPLKV